jgi:hypothetical protein
MERIPNLNEWIRKAELYKIKVQHILEEVGPERGNELNDQIARRVAVLMEKYPNFRSYAMYHAIAGSGIDLQNTEEPILYEDFPGPDSIASYIDNVVILG